MDGTPYRPLLNHAERFAASKAATACLTTSLVVTPALGCVSTQTAREALRHLERDRNRLLGRRRRRRTRSRQFEVAIGLPSRQAKRARQRHGCLRHADLVREQAPRRSQSFGLLHSRRTNHLTQAYYPLRLKSTTHPSAPAHDRPLEPEVIFCVQGAISPLLSNLMLDVLDKELEKRGHRFVRYADDCNIYVRSQRAGERVMDSIEQFLTKRLKLRVNKAKSAVAKPKRPQVPGLQLHEREATTAPDRAAGHRPLQSKGPGADAAHVRQEPLASRQGAVVLSDRMARLLRLLRDPFSAARTRPVDQTTAARHRLEAMEARTHTLQEAATPRRRPGIGGHYRRQPTWSLAAQQQPRAPHCAVKCLLHRLAPPRNRGA